MRKLLALLMCVCCGGCTALPAEERAFAVVLCVEKSGPWQVYGRIPAYKTDGEYLTVNGEGDTLTAAIADMDASAPMRVLLSQLRLLVLADNVEPSAVVDDLAGRVDVRQQCVLAVTEEDASNVMKALQPQSGARLSKGIDLLVDARVEQGCILRTTLADAACMGVRQSPVLALLTLEQDVVNLTGAWAAGKALTSEETAMIALLQGQTKELNLQLEQSNVKVRDASVKVHLAEDLQTATVCLRMCVTESKLTLDAMEKSIADACVTLLTRLSRSGCDVLGLARQAICHVSSMTEWQALDWPMKYRNIHWRVEVGMDGSI